MFSSGGPVAIRRGKPDPVIVSQCVHCLTHSRGSGNGEREQMKPVLAGFYVGDCESLSWSILSWYT